ncbi:ferrous iron transport protein B [soil metagenome]
MHNNKATIKIRDPLIALIGQPNSGKTTLYNYLSGKKAKTVNYPGSTVQYSISKILSKYHVNANILDSPGIISLVPFSPDEEVSVRSLYSHPEFGNPDIVIVTVDTSQISRHLFLVKQIIESNFNVIIVLTMNDILEKKGFEVSDLQLSNILGCCVVKFDGRTGKGLDELLIKMKERIEVLQSRSENAVPVVQYITSRVRLLESFDDIEDIESKIITDKRNGKVFGNTDVLIKKIDAINESIPVLNNRRPYIKPDENTIKLDKILLHKFWGLVIFFLIMAITFSSIFWLTQPLMDVISIGFGWLSDTSGDLLGNNLFSDLISKGIINGIGSVMVFLPQIVILFFIMELLEDSGYLARGAMLVDRPLSKIGLNGRSFVPMLSGFACAIPATMAARTIANKRERFLTIFILPLMTCSARIPVYALLVGFLIPRDKLYLGGIYFAVIYLATIVMSLIVGSIMNKFGAKLVKEKDNSSFILELPAYRKPKFAFSIRNTVRNASQYIKKAGPVILLLSLVIWFMTTFPNYEPEIKNIPVDTTGQISPDKLSHLKDSERLSTSYASYFGKFIEPVMKPMGFDWRIGVSLVATFAAREVFVSSLALIFKVTDEEESNLQTSLINAMREAKVGNTEQKLFTTATTIGLIIFFMFAMQCLSTTAIARKETGSWRIPILQIVVFTSAAYILTVVVVNGLRYLGVS